MSQLTIFHRSKDSSGRLPSMDAAIWATCLREMMFLDQELSPISSSSVKNIDVLHSGEALIFLLEIICGLHSPVVGETEIVGQFKTFVASLPEDHALKRDPTLLPFLFTTMKEARTRFLIQTGSLGYGQIVRRWVKDFDQVVLWGYGSLGQEIWPWIREKTDAVMVRTLRDQTVEIPFRTENCPKAHAHVIAAPVSDEIVQALAADAFVIDLRDGSRSSERVKSLKDLFTETSLLRRLSEEGLERCRFFLRDKVVEFQSRQQIRPFGWEDLCG